MATGIGVSSPRGVVIGLVWTLVCLQVALSLILSRSFFLATCGDLIQCVLLLALAVAIGTNVTCSAGRTRVFWILLGTGSAMWLCAQLLWTYFEVVLHREVPNPFAGDILFFLHLVPMMAALAVRPHEEPGDDINRPGSIDFFLLLAWWLYLYLFMVIPWQYFSSDQAAYGRNFNVLYFVEHAVFVLGTLGLSLRAKHGWGVVYSNLLGASFLYALSAIGASVAIDVTSYYTGSLYDVPLVASMAWFVTIALVAHRLASRTVDVPARRSGQSLWVGRTAIAAVLSLPILAAGAVYSGSAPGPVRSFRLVLTLAGMLVMGGLIAWKQQRMDEELARVNEELRESSLTDALTGVRNRRFFTSTIEGEIRYVLRSYARSTTEASKPNRDLLFYLIDADYFKEINDWYGHEQGDVLLVEMAKRISSAIRNCDVLVRWGGEEFLVVCRYTDRNDGVRLAERVLNAIAGEPFVINGKVVSRTCSVGWAAFPWFVNNPEAVDYKEVLRVVDVALYEAKRAGRNRAIGMVASDRSSPELSTQTLGNPLVQLGVRTISIQGAMTPATSRTNSEN